MYKKTNRLKVELKPHKEKVKGVFYYDTEGFEIIKSSYGEYEKAKAQGENRLNYSEDKLLNLLLSEKDKQISHLTEQLSKQEKVLEQAMKLVENNQVLLLQSQERVLMLETSTGDEKKSFWSKFKKGK